MKRWTYILLCLITSISAISCTETPDCREFQVPEIVSITSLPDVHSAVLISDLQTAPSGKIEVGFYIGKNRTELKRIYTTLSGKSFRLSVNDLEEKHIPRGINTFCFFVIGDFYNSFYIRTKERSP